MGKNRLEIEFTGAMRDGDYIEIEYTSRETNLTYNWRIQWKDLGYFDNSYFKTISIEKYAPYSKPNYDAYMYVEKLKNIDITQVLNFTQVGDKIVIQSSNNYEIDFINYQSNNTSVVFNYIEDTSTLDYEVTNIDIINGDCEKVVYVLDTSINTVKMIEPFNNIFSPDTTIIFQMLRNKEYDLKLESDDGKFLTYRLITPKKLLSSYIGITYVNNTLTINYSPVIDLVNQPLEYSIDGVSFSSTNTFNVNQDIVEVHVRDSYGCSIKKSFILVDDSKKQPYIFISKTNALRFSKREEWNLIETFKTDENTLSCEATDEIATKQIQTFHSSDTITTQVRTSYDNVTAYLLHNEDKIPLNCNMVRQFMNVKDSRECVILPYNGKSLVVFYSGNTFNYDTGVVTGDYELNGKLPYWYEVDSIVEFNQLGTFKIKEIVYSDKHNAKGFVIDYSFSGQQGFQSAVKIIYNIQPYNVFEFELPIEYYKDKRIRVQVNFEDDDFKNKTFISEIIEVRDDLEHYVCIDYWDENNGDILYETGIKNRLRVLCEKITNTPVSDVEIHTGDKDVSLIKSEYYEANTFVFSPQTKEVSKKLYLALLHKYLVINGVFYICENKPKEEVLGNSNLYEITATLLKTNSSFRSSNNYIKKDRNTVAVPKLINKGIEDGYIAYE